MDNFKSLGLPEALMNSLDRMKFTTPTPIQAQAIPPALEGKDILGSAQTGTGKTGAFGIPMIAKLMSNSRGSALVMTPTRELAVQVLKMLEELLGKQSSIKTALLIGGDSMPKQLQQLRLRPRVIVGTPGRINDHLERGSLALHDTNFLVLDETDRMLDMGFSIQIERILKFMPQQRQTLLFSATIPRSIAGMAEQYLRNPVRISVGATSTPVAKIKQETMHMAEADKYAQLVQQLDKREGSVIVFVKTKWGAEKLAIRLRGDHHSADAIHGDLRQNARDRVIQAFRNKKHRIMVATDIAARGLDIPHIEHVINYDLPQCPEDYIHRIGRTARAGAEGSAMCFITPADRIKWSAITRLIDPTAKDSGSDHHARSAPSGKKPASRPYSYKGAPRSGEGAKRDGAAPRRDGGNRSAPAGGARDGAAPKRDSGNRPAFAGKRDGAAPRREGGNRDGGSRPAPSTQPNRAPRKPRVAAAV
jgi:ATP-dependent RNA helicase DeaD